MTGQLVYKVRCSMINVDVLHEISALARFQYSGSELRVKDRWTCHTCACAATGTALQSCRIRRNAEHSAQLSITNVPFFTGKGD